MHTMSYSYFIINIDQQSVGTFFWRNMFFSNSLDITSTWSINQFILLNTFPFLFSQTFLVISSIFFSFDSWIFCHLLANVFPSLWLFLVLFCAGYLNKVTNDKTFAELFLKRCNTYVNKKDVKNYFTTLHMTGKVFV